MKKITLCAVLLVALTVGAFAQERRGEHWFSVGMPFTNVFDSGKGIAKNSFSAMGAHASWYFFAPNNFGLFFNSAMYSKAFASNLKSDYDVVPLLNWSLGPAYKYAIDEKMTLLFALALELNGYSIENKDAEDSKTRHYDSRGSWSIGADAGFAYNFTNALYLSAGTRLSLGLLGTKTLFSITDNKENKTTTTTDFNVSVIKNYFSLGITPYIAIGFNVNSGWGRRAASK